ncbi:MAG: quinol dehydrogenase ferredoxin subunit NapH [Nitrospirae bacterium]|nr:quinol dehydrogenase ferredoxin subunit NapH [Nitrospirota bacterium]MBF0533513.1 quinol dehydrogenase ferredoxin subunit NapH [Nitrospirota bacterium]MBF0615963.1 quinol dehydrogenase ferredoxin subunit NapH [Nitrospirota bacterium]
MLRQYRYTILRRLSQLTILSFFIMGSIYGLKVLRGNYSSARVFDVLTLSDPFAVLQSLVTGNIVGKLALTGALIVALFYAIIGGRAFCGWVCPMSLITGIGNSIRRAFDITFSYNADNNTRYLFLILALIVSAIAKVAAFEWISPIGVLHRGVIFGMSYGWMLIASVLVFDVLLVRNGFCGHLCPLGAFYALIGRGNLIKPYYNLSKCTLCMKCLKACPEKQVLNMVSHKSSLVKSGECIQCGRCIEVCDDNAITFKSRFSK